MNKTDLKWMKVLSLQRIFNAFLVYLSYILSEFSGRLIHFGSPVSISVEPAAVCNLRCPECPTGRSILQRNQGFMEIDLFQKLLDQIYKKTIYLTLYFQGEPFLNPSFFEMVSYAKTKKLFVATSTNCHFLDSENAVKTIESGLDRIIISIDGTTQEIYEKYRVGGKLEKVLQGAQNLVEVRKKLNSKTPEIIFQFLVTRQNEHQIEEMKVLAKKSGADRLELKTAQVYDFENGNELIPVNTTYSRYHKLPDGRFIIKNKLPNRCKRLWSSAVITHDGYFLPCCFDKDAHYPYGNLNLNTFKEIWHSREIGQFRKVVLNARRNIDICRNCTEGMKGF